MLSADRKIQINKLLQKLNITTEDIELFDTALTHPSYNYEANRETDFAAADYERLEFLGDSVLRLCVSDYLFNKYPDYDEGKLTKIRSFIVSDKFLAQIAHDLGIRDYIKVGPGEQKDGGRDKESIQACVAEAIFGAVYISRGFEYAMNFICNIYSSLNTDINYIMYSYNAKETLQQYTQGLYKDLPEYSVIKETGQEHNKTFEVSVRYRGKELGRGSAKTKKEAERMAAVEALKVLKIQGKQ